MNLVEDQQVREIGGLSSSNPRLENEVRGLPFKFSISTHDLAPSAFDNLRRRMGSWDPEQGGLEKDTVVANHGVELT